MNSANLEAIQEVDQVVLQGDGSVEIDGLPIPGRWHHVQLGAAYYEDAYGDCTEVMAKNSLRVALAASHTEKYTQGATGDDN